MHGDSKPSITRIDLAVITTIDRNSDAQVFIIVDIRLGAVELVDMQTHASARLHPAWSIFKCLKGLLCHLEIRMIRVS
jgi:hypothetical protein